MYLIDMFNKKTKLPSAAEALPGRTEPIIPPATHYVLGTPVGGEIPAGMETAYFGMGCFWGAERLFWQMLGVYSTSAGYAGGQTPNPTYQETVTGMTGHTEVVRVVFDPIKVSYDALLQTFFEEHDPTQGMRQGNDIGTTYRSAIYATTPAQLEAAKTAATAYQSALKKAGHSGRVTTEIISAPEFYFAEDYHQQYLAKNPSGYCGLRGTGVACPGSPAETD